MSKVSGHERMCQCPQCVSRREAGKRYAKNFRDRQRSQGLVYDKRKKDKRASAAGPKRLIEKHLEHHPEYGSMTLKDVVDQLMRQNWECYMTGRELAFNKSARHPNSYVLRRNDPLEPWNSDNIRVVSRYAERYAIDRGWGGTLDRYKELRQTGKL